MKTQTAVLTMLLSFLPACSQAMPGMTMPPAQSPEHHPKTHSKPKAKTDQQETPAAKPEGKADGGMEGMPGMTTSQPEPAGGVSITHDTMTLQEPETPRRQTGNNLPAPELLQAVAVRRAMALEEFLKLAEASNPTLAQARAIVQQAAAEAKQAGLYPNPSVGYQGDQIRGGQYGGGEQGGYVQQTIVLGGKLGLRRAIHERERLAGEAGVEEQAVRVRSEVSVAFYEALTAQAQVVLRQRLVKLAADAVETAHQLANVGQADAPDVLQAEVEAEQTKIEFVAAQRTFLGRFTTLAALCGSPAMPPAPLDGQLETPPQLDAAAQIATAVSASPAIKRLQQQVEVEQAKLNSARREWIPDLNLKAGEQYSFEQLGGLPARPVGPQSFASAGIGLPLWNRNQGSVAAAKVAVERARNEVLRTQLMLRAGAEPVAQAYLAASYRAQQYRTQIIPRAQRAYELYLGKYATMAVAYPQVLVSQRTLFQVQMSYLEALRDEWTNALALQNFMLRGGLEAPASVNQTAPASGALYGAPE